MKFAIALTCVLFMSVLGAWCDEGHHHELTEQEVGSVHFATSCSAAVQPSFQRAVALLHSFQYEQARAGFQEVATQDPTCAMAHWGIAMSHYHGLWDNGDTAAGRQAIAKAGQIAGTASVTPRERGYIDALTEVYREDSNTAY